MGAFVLPLIQAVLGAFSGQAQVQLAPIITQLGTITGAPTAVTPGSKDEAIVNLPTAVLGMIMKAGGAPPNPTPVQQVEATAAVLADPAKVKAVEVQTVDAVEQLNKMTPLFDRLAAYDKQTAELELASRNAAAGRGQQDKEDISPFLSRSSTYIVGLSTLVLLGAIIAALFIDPDGKAAIALVGLGGPLLQRAFSNLAEVFSYRYGGTSTGNASEVARSEVAKTQAAK